MLRHAAATPALRAHVSRLTATHLARRHLVSSVLLTKEAYDARKVPDLKSELKQRGLSTTGKRDELIRRLLQDDARKAGSFADAAPQAQRTKSTLASLRQGGGEGEKKKQQQQPATPAPAPSATSSPAGKPVTSVPSPQTNTAGAKQVPAKGSKDERVATLTQASDKQGDLVVDPTVVVSTQSGRAAPVGASNLLAEDIAELKEPGTNPPGKPPSVLPDPPRTFEIIIPYEQVPPVAGPEVPLMTAYTQPGEQDTEMPFVPAPKVITASGTSTMLGGGVSSAAQDAGLDDDHHHNHQQRLDNKNDQPSSPLNALLDDMKADLGVAPQLEKRAKKMAANAANAAASSSTASAARTALDEVASALPESIRSTLTSGGGLGGNSKKSSHSSSGSNGSGGSSTRAKPLNDEERTGAYVLGAILAGGFFLGGLGNSKSSLAHDDHSKSSHDVVTAAASTAHQAAGEAIDDVVRRAEEALGRQPSSSQQTLSAGKGRVGKALGDLGNPSHSQPQTANFASAAGIVGNGPRKV